MVTQQEATSVYARRPWTKYYDPGVPTAIDDPNKTLPDILAEQATQVPERAAIIFYDSVLTYRELDRASTHFASALIGLGLQAGDRVALLLPNTPQFVIGYYGALRAGAIVVPSNPLYSASELEHQLNDSGATTVLTLSKFFPLVQAVRTHSQLKHVIVTNIKEYFPLRTRMVFTLLHERKEGHRVRLPEGDGTYWFRELLEQASPAQARRVRPDDVALLQYTGGTTGTAKGAILTHRNLISGLYVIRAWQGNDRPARGYDVIMGALPLFHIYGMATVMDTAILNAGAMILTPRFEPASVLKMIQRYRPNLFPGVPTMYVRLYSYPEVKKYDLSSLEACISSAAPLSIEVKQRFEDLGAAKLVEGFGMTETAPVTHANPIHGLNKPGSIGIPMPSTEAMIVDVETGTEVLPAGATGELVLRGPQVMQGYWNRDDETDRVLRNGWLYTGDIARMDEDGYFSIIDRKKDIIISGGMKIYPREIEEVLVKHPKVQEVVAIGLPDEEWGEHVKVLIVLQPGATATEAEIADYCRSHLAPFKVPKAVEFRQELPRTMIGKVLRRVLRDDMRKSASIATVAASGNTRERVYDIGRKR